MGGDYKTRPGLNFDRREVYNWIVVHDIIGSQQDPEKITSHKRNPPLLTYSQACMKTEESPSPCCQERDGSRSSVRFGRAPL